MNATKETAAPAHHDFQSAWRCRYGHTSRLSIREGFSLGSSWDWCNHCGECPSPVDRMRMMIDILNQWLRAGLVDSHYFHAMANWVMTEQERDWKYFDRSERPVTRGQLTAVRLMTALDDAVLALELLTRWRGKPELLEEAERLRFRSKVMVAANGLDTDVSRYSDPMWRNRLPGF